ncbi:MAG: inverse autotransporter beta domain-containing protein [Enterobacteriaceae bacterium]|jgi:adhesin/invasin|nr:inverse autotransporter beta domain-containing protein [Enterobacteriaceae bacterium]
MLSWVRKTIAIFIFFYTLFIPSAMTGALVESNIEPEKQVTYLNDSDYNNQSDISKFIANNIQTANSILSSSSSELKEQATSYALDKFNSTVLSEMEKWLSQFGTVRINFGLDREWTLKNNSFDLLLPLYDNKADWLFFSQLGYRNKDSRNTINFGLGGRYFYQNWMYGINTFYDYDITGKNRRLGLGGEIWSDYVKFSANTYHRLSDWQDSRKFNDYYERPANGYDINSEFFLPFYPNLGAKLSYEQYFGDNVTLFDRKTRQKNPALAKIGLTYTPIPLITLGADYKQGTGNRTEMQFMANLNIRLGASLSEQLSPGNVASMRTLAGSRYNLVERNNNIVLDHKNVPIAQFLLPKTIVGYSRQQTVIPIKLSSDSFIKQIHISAGKEKNAFEKNKGKLSFYAGEMQVILPEFLSGENEKNTYTLYLFTELTNNQKTKPQQIQIIVKPFEIYHRDEVNYTPPGPLPASGNIKDGYTFYPAITFDTPDKTPSELTINNVQWITEPPVNEKSGLEFHSQYKFDQLKTDKEGYFSKENRVILTSKKSIKDVKVYLVMDGQPKKLVGTVSFDDDSLDYKVKEIEVTPDGDLTADGEQTYTYTALITDGKNPVKNTKITNVKWNIDNPIDGLILKAPEGEVQTDSEGKLKATLSSTKKAGGIMVSLVIEKQPSAKAKRSVSFKLEGISVTTDSAEPKLVHDTYLYTATVTDIDGKPEANKTVQWKLQGNTPGVTLGSVTGVTGSDGKVTTKLTSSVAASNIIVTASTGGNTQQAKPIEFKWPIIQKPSVTPKGGDVNNDGTDTYSYSAMVYELDGITPYIKQDIKFKWHIQQSTGDDLTRLLTSGEVSPTSKGELINKLVSSHNPPIKDAVICVAIVTAENEKQCADPVDYKLQPVDFEIASVEVENFSPTKRLQGNGKDEYKFKALIIKKGGNVNDSIPNHTFSGVDWNRTTKKTIDVKYLPKPEWISTTTDDKGFLYGTLKSYAGVNDVSVKLTIPSELPGKNAQFKEVDKAVSFASDNKAVINVYKLSDKNVNKIFYEPHPYNYFENIVGELWALEDSGEIKPLDQSKISYSFTPKTGARRNAIKVGNDNKGPLEFFFPGSGIITATITEDDGRFYLYHYAINLVREIAYGGSNEILYGKQRTSSDVGVCNKDGTAYHENISVQEFVRSSGVNAINTEFPDLFGWGLFEKDRNVKNREDIQYKLTDKNNKFLMINPVTEKIYADDRSEGYLICQFRVSH